MQGIYARNNAKKERKKERHADFLESTCVSVIEERKERCAPRLVYRFQILVKGRLFDTHCKI